MTGYVIYLIKVHPHGISRREHWESAVGLACLGGGYTLALVVLSLGDLTTGRYMESQSVLAFLIRSAPLLPITGMYMYALHRVWTVLLTYRNRS